jgi:hypothetical protein
MLNMREAWTDEGLDDLNAKIDDLGKRMDEGFRDLNGRLDGVQRTMVQFMGVMVAAMASLFAALVGLIVAQL